MTIIGQIFTFSLIAKNISFIIAIRVWKALRGNWPESPTPCQLWECIGRLFGMFWKVIHVINHEVRFKNPSNSGQYGVVIKHIK